MAFVCLCSDVPSSPHAAADIGTSLQAWHHVHSMGWAAMTGLPDGSLNVLADDSLDVQRRQSFCWR